MCLAFPLLNQVTIPLSPVPLQLANSSPTHPLLHVILTIPVSEFDGSSVDDATQRLTLGQAFAA